MPPWGPDQKYRLLLACIIANGSGPPKWEDVVKLMGEDYTTESVRQQYQKLKKNFAVELGSAATPSTPKNPSTPKTPTSRKRKTISTPSDHDERDEDEEDAKPVKKVKKEQMES